MWISRYVCLFMIYSFIGWIYETVFCTIKEGKWENRGFLFGPACPVYGSGAVAISCLVNVTDKNSIEINTWQIFIISVLGSALLEYVTSWGLEKLFHAVWWDYSKLPLNIHGRVSFFTSLGFGFAGLLVVYYIAPISGKIMNEITPVMTEFLALMFLFLFTVDLTLTIVSLWHFDRVVVRLENNFNRNMEMLVDSTVQHSNRIKQDLIEKRQAGYEQMNHLSGLVKGTVQRVYSFKHKDKQKEKMFNSSLLMIRKTRMKSKTENEDKN